MVAPIRHAAAMRVVLALCACTIISCGETAAPPAAPAISGVQPAPLTVQSGAVQLTVNGSHFEAASRVQWNGHDRATTFESATRVRAQLQAGDLASAGTAIIHVVNGAVRSADFGVEVRNPAPVVTRLQPDTVFVGSGAQVLRLRGSGFTAVSQARVNGAPRATAFLADTTLEMQLLAGDVVAGEIRHVSVVNPAPGGGESGLMLLGLQHPPPVIAAVEPATLALAQDVQLVVTGTGFVQGAMIHWNGALVQGAWVDATRFDVQIPSFMTETAGSFNLVISNPAPGGGMSAPFAITVANPVPVLTSVTPDSLASDAGAVTLTVRGQSFANGATVGVGGTARPTQRISATELAVTMTAAAVADVGTHGVVVHNPAPGGGASQARTLRITAAPPRLAQLAPAWAVQGGAAFQLVVTGASFNSGMVLRWDGSGRATTLLPDGSLRADIPASDLATAGSAIITVHDPATGLSSAPLTFAVVSATPSLTPVGTLYAAANDIVHDAVRNRIYASIGKDADEHAGSVVVINPATAAIVSAIPVAGDPARLALGPDAAFLYVGLRDAPRVVRVDLATGASIDLDVTLRDECGMHIAEDLLTLPGSPHSIVVSVRNTGCSPAHEGVIMFDGAVRRPRVISGQAGPNQLVRSTSGSELFGYHDETSLWELYRIRVVADGLEIANTYSNVITGYPTRIAHDGGFLYATSGVVVSTATMNRIGTVPHWDGVLAPDAQAGRLYVVAGGTLHMYHYTALSKIADAPFSFSGAPSRLIRWGSDGLALLTRDGVFIVRMSP